MCTKENFGTSQTPNRNIMLLLNSLLFLILFIKKNVAVFILSVVVSEECPV